MAVISTCLNKDFLFCIKKMKNVIVLILNALDRLPGLRIFAGKK